MKQAIILIVALVSALAAQETSFSWYNAFYQYVTGGFYGDGTYFHGPFRVNSSPVWIWSFTPGRDNDPHFQRFILSSDFYYCGSEQLPDSVPHPEGSNLWIEPYEMMSQGEPWFHLGAPEVPFGPDEIDWETVRAAAIMYGLYLEPPQVIDGSRMILTDTYILLRTTDMSPIDSICLDSLSEPVVWIENEPSDRIYIKGFFGASYELKKDLMIGTIGDIFACGHLHYDQTEPGMLGLMSVEGDFVIANDPDNTGGSDWREPFNIMTDNYVYFSASIITPSGMLESENYQYPEPRVDFSLYGGFQGVCEGITSTPNSGFKIGYYYDPRLQNESPPWYPQNELLAVWDAGEPEAADLRIVPGTNPFHSSVKLTLQGTGQVCRMEVLDLSGRCVETADIQNSLVWNGEGLPAGVYIIRVQSPKGEMAFCSVIKN